MEQLFKQFERWSALFSWILIIRNIDCQIINQKYYQWSSSLCMILGAKHKYKHIINSFYVCPNVLLSSSYSRKCLKVYFDNIELKYWKKKETVLGVNLSNKAAPTSNWPRPATEDSTVTTTLSSATFLWSFEFLISIVILNNLLTTLITWEKDLLVLWKD